MAWHLSQQSLFYCIKSTKSLGRGNPGVFFLLFREVCVGSGNWPLFCKLYLSSLSPPPGNPQPLSYPFTHWWMYGLSLPFGYRDYYCNEHWHTIICIPVFSSFGYTEKVYLRVELLGHIEILCLVFGFSAKLFSRVCTILHFHLKCTRILIFPNPRWHLLIYYYYQYHLCRHELVPHWGTDTHFPNDLWCWTFFHVFIGHL